MNRLVKALVPAAVLIGSAVAPAAGAPRQRVETAAYERASGVHLMDVVWIEIAAGELPEARPLGREKTVSITIADDSGRPVAADVHQGEEVLGSICGQTESPLTLVSREPVHLHVYSGAGCSDVSTPTQGTIEFTFAR